MQESRLTGIPKWRERLGIEPGQLSTIPAFRGLRDQTCNQKPFFILSIHTSPHQFINTL